MNASRRSEVRTNALALSDSGIVRVIVVFVGVFAVLESATALLNRAGFLRPAMSVTASATGFMANLTGVPATASRAEVFLENHILVINAECTGVYLFVAYIALVLASRRSWSSRSVGVAAGIPALVLANLIRLFLVVHAADKLPGAFPFLHDYLFQVLLVVAVLVVWGVWLAGSDPHAA